MVGWHPRLDRHEFEQALGVADGEGSLHAAVHGVAKSRTQLSDWTELNTTHCEASGILLYEKENRFREVKIKITHQKVVRQDLNPGESSSQVQVFHTVLMLPQIGGNRLRAHWLLREPVVPTLNTSHRFGFISVFVTFSCFPAISYSFLLLLEWLTLPIFPSYPLCHM